MLKIELIRFEAQDVITASGTCACANNCNQWRGHWHWLGGMNWCRGDDNGDHFCGH